MGNVMDEDGFSKLRITIHECNPSLLPVLIKMFGNSSPQLQLCSSPHLSVAPLIASFTARTLNNPVAISAKTSCESCEPCWSWFSDQSQVWVQIKFIQIRSARKTQTVDWQVPREFTRASSEFVWTKWFTNWCMPRERRLWWCASNCVATLLFVLIKIRSCGGASEQSRSNHTYSLPSNLAQHIVATVLLNYHAPTNLYCRFVHRITASVQLFCTQIVILRTAL